jgi:conjugative relaxase-like TrwC/TraI family protein
MLRIFQSDSAANAKGYYASGLEDAHNYYVAGAAKSGLWFGKTAQMLGLSGEVMQEQFHLLCDNQRPDTLEKLNPRENTKRKIGYDMTFSAPKSVSILQGIIGEQKVISIFQQAVRETMSYLEQDAHVRVRKNGLDETRRTGNLVWGEFMHFESRPIDGISDVNLHCHCYCFNTSYDAEEGRFKAAEFFNIKRDAPYYEAIFHSRLAQGLKSLGYQIENKAYGFEVPGVGDENIKRFSRRAAEIEELAERLGIAGNDKAKDKLASITRKSKKMRFKGADKLAEWRSRLDWSALNLEQPPMQAPRIVPARAVQLAIENMFERKSVVSFRRLIACAIQNSLGDCTVNEIFAEIRGHKDLVVTEKNGEYLATTHGIIAEEKASVEYLAKSASTQMAIDPLYQANAQILDDDQCDAVEAILKASDRVIAVEGRAGTGKTTLLREVVVAMQAAGQNVFTFAPTSQAVQVLKDEGFEQSQTIQQLLVNPELQNNIRGAVLWIDEAGLLSTREMKRLFEIAEEHGARLVLSGDRYQHHSVERGDAFRMVVESGKISVKQTRTVHRQRSDAYRLAVMALSNGNVADGVAMLDEMGAIREIADVQTRITAQAEEYAQSVAEHRTVLVIAPTHFEGRLLTVEVRRQLREMGKLSDFEIEIPIHRSRNLTDAEKRMAQFYAVGDVVRFHQNAKGGFRKGDVLRVTGIASQAVHVERSGEISLLDFDLANHFGVFVESQIDVAVGEKLRVTRNAKSAAGKRLFNGSVHEVTGIFETGEIVLDGKHRVDSRSGFLDYGYVSTSHSSQGKTADKVIVSQSSLSAEAASLEQFYVSVSRGRDEIVIFTDDKFSLIEAVSQSNQRMCAMALEEMETAIHQELHSQYNNHWRES